MTAERTASTDPSVVDTARPVLRARAPLRISFAGGGTDVAPFPQREGGAVLSATISSYAYATLRPRRDGRITVQSLDFGTSIGFAVDEPVEFDGELLAVVSRRWMRVRETYAVDIVREDADPALLIAVAVCVIHLAEKEREED